jgi:hypothetical protein
MRADASWDAELGGKQKDSQNGNRGGERRHSRLAGRRTIEEKHTEKVGRKWAAVAFFLMRPDAGFIHAGSRETGKYHAQSELKRKGKRTNKSLLPATGRTAS